MQRIYLLTRPNGFCLSAQARLQVVHEQPKLNKQTKERKSQWSETTAARLFTLPEIAEVHKSKCAVKRPSSPKPREIEDILQLASIKTKCTTETECRFKGNCCLKLPLAESCLWRAKKSVGTKVAFPVSRTDAEFPVGWSNWEFWSGNQYSSPGLMNQCRVFLLV